MDGRAGLSASAIGRAFNVALLVLCQSTQALTFGGIALFLPLIRKDFQISFTQAGSVAAASAVVYALLQIPSGYLADRVGPKRVFLVGVLGTNLLSLSLAHLSTYWMLLANQALQGMFRSLLFAPGLLLISSLFTPARRATAMALYTMGGFGSNVFLNIAGPVLAASIGWRGLFTYFSLAGIVLIILYWRFGSPGPGGIGPEHAPRGEWLNLFRHRAMWLVGGIQFVRLSVVYGLTFWLPSYVIAEKGGSLQLAGLLVAIGAATTPLSNLLGGYISDRTRNPLLVIGTSLGMLSLTTLLLVQTSNLVLLAGVVALNAFFIQFYFGPLFAFPISLFGTRRAGVTSGFGNFFANLGGVTFAYTLGAVKDATGSFAGGLYGVSGMCIFGLLCTIALARTERPPAPNEVVPAAAPR